MQRIPIRGGLVIAALALSGCGAEQQTSRTNAQIGGAGGTELASEQVLHWGNGSEPQGLDPHKSEGVPGSNIQRDLFEGLVNEAPNGELVPGGAESWQIDETGTVYTFNLRPNARWSNGDPVTAHDWVYGLRRSANPATGSRYTFILESIRNAAKISAGELPADTIGARAIDDYTLEISLEAPTPYFLGLLAHSSTYPMHRASVEAYGERVTRPGNFVTNGAYRLEEWVAQSHVRLVRNPWYWDNESTIIDEVFFHAQENRVAEIARYRADELDITYTDLPVTQLDWIMENLADELVTGPYLGSYYYGFNMTKPPFRDNPALRRALTLAVDRDIITTQIRKAGEIPAFGWVPPVLNYEGQQMPEAAWTQEEREAEARRLYAEAGYSKDNPLEVEILYNTEDSHRVIAIAVASMWREVLGVETAITNQEWKVYLDTRRQKIDTQVYRAGWIGDYNDANTFAALFLSTSEMNDSGYVNPRYDELVYRAAGESDLEIRAEYLQEAERIFLEDLPVMPLYFYATTRLVKPWVAGFEHNIMNHHHSKDLRILAH
ncbi:MAG: peptide ABC transporter substrate-binding protein [Gammaproteobacteria bacterium]|jgi:oligopeptide transport system substrate-binding protein